jgi:hypothetical protein
METKISDQGLKNLERLRGLELLAVKGTAVSDRGVQAFKRAVPGALVVK